MLSTFYKDLISLFNNQLFEFDGGMTGRGYDVPCMRSG